MATFSLEKIAELTNPANIQAQLDALVAQHGLERFVEYIRYIPQGATVSATAPDATHVCSICSGVSPAGEGVFVAVKGKAPYSWFLDLILSRI